MAIVDQIRRMMRREGGAQPEAEPAQTAAVREEDSRSPRVGRAQIAAAVEALERYRAGKSNLEARIIENEEWYKLRHWRQIRRDTGSKPGDPEPASAWLFNSLANKHADAMDNYPMANILPQEDSDKAEAKKLSSIVPVVMEQNEYEQTYSDVWWYKLKTGTGVYGVFWNPSKLNGLGDVDIRKIDILNLFWEPGIMDIQDSRNVFLVDLQDNDLLEQQYPQLRGKLASSAIDVSHYVYDDTVDTSAKSAVVDWYYKLNVNGRTVLHFCKFVGDTVLYATEDDVLYAQRGLYDHGKYPFVFDTLFREEGTPCGFGYVDIMKDCQMYIDKMGQAIIKNALVMSKPRYFISNTSAINENEFRDMDNDLVHVTGGRLGEDSIRQIVGSPLSSVYVAIMNNKIEELKETSGNRDFSQGGTTGGVTAASAISALMEAGSKLSRDMIKGSYRAYKNVCYLTIELIRQFYDEPRCFRITGVMGEEEFVAYDNRGMLPQKQGSAFGMDMGVRIPLFDIKVVPQKSSPYSKMAQNELALQFFGAGFFNPQLVDQALACLDMMDFDGKDSVMQKISNNGALTQKLQQAQAQLMQLAQIVDHDRGTNLAQSIAASIMGQPMPAPSSVPDDGGMEINSLGGARPEMRGKQKETAERAANQASPR